MADKVVQLVDKNSNNLYPVAGSAITNAISTGAISNQAVTTDKIADANVTTVKLANNAVTTAKITGLNVTTEKLANGAVTGVANDATSIGTAKLALDTVGTPNLRDASVTSDKIDFTTFWPVGSYYETSDTAFDPNVAWGGTWVNDSGKWHRTA